MGSNRVTPKLTQTQNYHINIDIRVNLKMHAPKYDNNELIWFGFNLKLVGYIPYLFINFESMQHWVFTSKRRVCTALSSSTIASVVRVCNFSFCDCNGHRRRPSSKLSKKVKILTPPLFLSRFFLFIFHIDHSSCFITIQLKSSQTK